MTGEVRELYADVCCGCHKGFWFTDPARTPTVLIDPVTGLPPDLGGDPERARGEPVCPPCFFRARRLKAELGKPSWQEPAGGWPPEYQEEEDARP